MGDWPPQQIEAAQHTLHGPLTGEDGREQRPVGSDNDRELAERGVVDSTIGAFGYAVILFLLNKPLHLVADLLRHLIPPVRTLGLLHRLSDELPNGLLEAIEQLVVLRHLRS